MVAKKKHKEQSISFTQYEKTCEHHVATDDRRCYCDAGEKPQLCNKLNCWKFNGSENKPDE